MNIDEISYINGFLSAFAGINSHRSDISFGMHLLEVEDINSPYHFDIIVELEKLDDWEDYTAEVLDKWLFMFIDEENIDFKKLFFADKEMRAVETKNLVERLKKGIKPINVFVENKIDSGDLASDRVIFQGKDKNYLLYLSFSD